MLLMLSGHSFIEGSTSSQRAGVFSSTKQSKLELWIGYGSPMVANGFTILLEVCFFRFQRRQSGVLTID